MKAQIYIYIYLIFVNYNKHLALYSFTFNNNCKLLTTGVKSNGICLAGIEKWCILKYGPLTETRKSELVLFYICYKTGIMGVCQCKQLVFGNKTQGRQLQINRNIKH